MRLNFSNILVIALFVLGLVFIGVSIANAQEIVPPEQLPPTAGEAVGWVQAFLVLLAGLIGNRATEWISHLNIGWLSKQDHERMRQFALDIIAFVLSVGSGLALPYLTSAAEYLDTSGIWLILVAAYPVCRAWFIAQKATTSKTKLAVIPRG